MKLEGFCPQNDSFSYSWQHHGVHRCFMETVSTATLFSWILVCWVVELYLYKRYATRVDENERPNTALFRIQVAATIFLSLLSVVRFLLQATVMNVNVVYGYMLLVAVGGTLLWPLSLWLILLERKYVLPSIPAWGHSLGLLFFWTLSFVVENLSFLNLRNDMWWFRQKNLSDQIELGLFVMRYICTLMIFFLGLRAPGLSFSVDALTFRFPHRRLLEEGQINEQSASSVQLHRRSTFRNIWKKMRLLLPFLWPRKALLLQTYVLICFLLLLVGRVINVFTPIYYKKIVDSLSSSNSKEGLVFRWDLILTYGSFMFLQGGGAGSMGFLNNFRSFLWIRVQQFTSRELGVQLFAHLHRLSLSWHLKRKTGEVLRSVDRGTNSISSLLSYILFNIMPTIADIIIAIIYFITAFNAWFGLIVFLTMALYLGATILLTEWRTKYRRSMNQLDNAANARAVDSLLNFETVKYYAAEEFEVSKYREAILEYQVAEWKTSASMSLLNTIQGTVITTGLLVSALYCAHLVVTHQQLTAGDYVLLSTYILQLYGPLNWFGTYYRMIQTAFVDMENMFDLLETDEDVKDIDGAVELKVSEGVLEFNNVCFSYNLERPILKNISFVVPPGKTVALVGPTGSGKTTIVRLLFRLYDIQSGQIFIDGQNIRSVAQRSLRKFIGVVPQDTVLFNKTIRYNIHYGRVTATDDEVENAAKSAEIHDQILVFPEGYNSVVGERGLKLSGGEKQRVAIARTILKAPSIILLDEATSALDTRTERQIQTALSNVCANKTTLVVAHRLSTIVNADEILVLKDGEIIERGRHEELLGSDGLYASMWKHQLKKQIKDGSNGQAEESSESVGYMSD